MAFMLNSFLVFGQGTITPSWAMYSILGVLILAGLSALVGLTANLIDMEAHKHGVQVSEDGWFTKFLNQFTGETKSSKVHKLNRGFEILINGEVKSSQIVSKPVSRVALKPYTFIGLSPIPKVVVEVGQSVKAGDEVYHDKKHPEIKFTSPVSGEVIEINRGDKRAIADIVILADKDQQYKKFNAPGKDADRAALVSFLVDTGAWTWINERPFDVVPQLSSQPKNIFISTFDTAPLAPDNNLIVAGNEQAFQDGIDVLARLTEGKVYLGLDGSNRGQLSTAFTNAKNADLHYFEGKHPAGNVGVQIHHIAPIKSGEKVWTMRVQDVIALGKLFATGEVRRSAIVAIAGNEVKEPQYVSTFPGASVAELTQGNVTDGKLRYISGDVLSGKQVSATGFMNEKDDQLTVIEEGDFYEMFGWLMPLSPRPSASGTYPNGLFPKMKFDVNTNTHGEKRAFVVTGQYEEVLPMDIYPQHLFKSILTKDVEMMEGLGINELSEEDVALCEFVCTSKQPLQQLLREGLDYMRTEA